MITDKYVEFFKGLEANNNRDWFQANKKSYDQDVKAPFLSLLDSLIPQIMELSPGISMEPKDALFRINRDVRFSKDKTPYNTLMKAGFSPGGRKSFLPGFYLGISADKIHVGGGLFNVQTPELKKVRDLIVDDRDEFNDILNDKSFVDAFGALKGEQAKRLDIKYKEILDSTPNIANKQFYAFSDFDLEPHLNSNTILEKVMGRFKIISPLNQYLQRAF